MDLFIFDKDDIGYTDSHFISDYTSIAWVERYRKAGEFKVTAPLRSGILKKMTLIAIVSHTQTRRMMLVENHRIVEAGDSEPIVEVSGRSFEVWLENRVVGVNQPWNDPLTMPIVSLYPDWAFNQATNLINLHIAIWNGANADENVQGLAATAYAHLDASDIAGYAPQVGRIIERGNLYERVQELLVIDDFGIRAERGEHGALAMWCTFTISNGEDKTSSVIFSAKNNNIENSEYLMTNLLSKNVAVVTGRWIEALAYGPAGNITGYDRQETFVSAEDIDNIYADPPAVGSAERIAVKAALTVRGQQALADKNKFLLARCDIAKTTPYRYRTDYNVGDFVLVETSFGGTYMMRVVEYTEIEDKTGTSGHPTLEVIQ